MNNRGYLWLHSISLLSLMIVLFSPSTAQANIGLPMLVYIMPASWILFFPIVVIEGWVARSILGIAWKSALLRSALANAASTLVGVPLIWAILVVIEMLTGFGVNPVATLAGRSFGMDSFFAKLLSVAFAAPWLPPSKHYMDWMIPVAGIILIFPFFFASVFIERWIFAMKSDMQKPLVRLWSWKGNIITYGRILCSLIIVLAYDTLK
jgi:hypothetical protein